MATLTFDVVRPDDMLVVRFELAGWAIELLQVGAPARLVRIPSTNNGTLVAWLPAQSLAEPAFQEFPGVDLVGLPASLTAVPSILSGPSRLAFRIPSSISSLPLTLSTLLEWERFEPLSAIDDETPHGPQDGPGRPGRRQTALELPYRLLLTTVEGATWVGAGRAPNRAGPVALWQVALAAAPGAGLAAVRAAWTPDLDRPTDPFPLNALSSAARREIVQMTGDPRILLAAQASDLSETENTTLAQIQAEAAAMPVERLTLTALGGDLRIRRVWQFPTISFRLQQLIYGDDAPLAGDRVFALKRWEHDAVLGRDHRVQTLTEGRLFPLQHRTMRGVLSERALRPTPGANDATAYIAQRAMLSFVERERHYDQRDWPFRTVRIVPATLEVPADGSRFTVPVVATDWAGQEHALNVPSMFAATGIALDNLVQVYQDAKPSAACGGQALTYLAVSAAATEATPPDAGRFPTLALNLAAQLASGAPGGFAPSLLSAVIRVEALGGLVGAAGQTATMAYDPAFIAQGLTGDDRSFAKLERGISIGVSAAELGGLAAPSMVLDTLSLTRGLSVGRRGDGEVDASALLAGLGGKLLGFVDLRSIVDTSSLDEIRPLLKTIGRGAEQEVRFHWTPRLRLPKPLVVLGGHAQATLEVSGVTPARNRPGARVSTEGKLSHFAVQFADLVEIGFESLAFSARSGELPQVRSVAPDFRFLGDLAFLRPLAAVLQAAAPGSVPGTRVALGPDGLVASFRQALPNIALGQFALVNVALEASLELRFSEPAIFTLALSSRRDPFLVSYSAIGGGGFFSLSVDVAGPRRLEASIELGAVAEIDLFLAKGSAHILIGIYICWRAGHGSELGGFVRIHGALQVLGIVTLGVDVRLMLTYEDSRAIGRAEVTLFVQILMFSRSVSLSVERSFDTSLIDPTQMSDAVQDNPAPNARNPRSARFDDSVNLAQWTTYCQAFAT